MSVTYPPVYLFDTTNPDSPRRLARTASLLDPATISTLAHTGVSEGWSCLEVGDTGGSITEWLMHRVGLSGYVRSTDIDTTHLDAKISLRRPWVEISALDVSVDPLPERAFDLIHSRLCLAGIPERLDVLKKFIRSLRPGGWLVIEDFDPHILSRGYATRDQKAADLHRRMCAAMGRVFAGRGFEVGWGRSLHGRLRDLGLVDTGMTATLTAWEGGSAGALIDVANFNEVRDAVVCAGLMTDAEIDELVGILHDPQFEISSPLFCSAWGRKDG